MRRGLLAARRAEHRTGQAEERHNPVEAEHHGERRTAGAPGHRKPAEAAVRILPDDDETNESQISRPVPPFPCPKLNTLSLAHSPCG